MAPRTGCARGAGVDGERMVGENVSGLQFRSGEGADGVATDLLRREHSVLVGSGAEFQCAVEEAAVFEGQMEDNRESWVSLLPCFRG